MGSGQQRNNSDYCITVSYFTRSRSFCYEYLHCDFFESYMSGVGSKIVGVFDGKIKAEKYVASVGFGYLEEKEDGLTVCTESEKDYIDLANACYEEDHYRINEYQLNKTLL